MEEFLNNLVERHLAGFLKGGLKKFWALFPEISSGGLPTLPIRGKRGDSAVSGKKK